MGQKLNWTATLGLTTALLAASLPMQPVVAETPSVTQLVDAQLEQMTLEQKIGQMIMPDFRLWNGVNHTQLAPEVGRIIDRFDLGGVILFAENVSETEQTTKLVHDLQEVVEQDPSNDIPLFTRMAASSHDLVQGPIYRATWHSGRPVVRLMQKRQGELSAPNCMHSASTSTLVRSWTSTTIRVIPSSGSARFQVIRTWLGNWARP